MGGKEVKTKKQKHVSDAFYERDFCFCAVLFARRRQGTERGAGPGGSERLAEEDRRRVSERERSHSYKEFQGKVAQETDKVIV